MNQGCSTTKSLREPPSEIHFEHCQPHCSSCYYKHRCRRWLGPASTSSYQYYYSPHNHTQYILASENPRANAVERLVCRFCANLEDATALMVRVARDKNEMEHLMLQELKCANCHWNLPKKGPLWWACERCEGECVNEIHPTWRHKAKKNL